MTTKSTITTRNPAEETAAAVSSPDIADATLSPAKTRRMMKRITIPRGVRITPMIEPVELLPIQHTSQKTEMTLGEVAVFSEKVQEFDGIFRTFNLSQYSNLM